MLRLRALTAWALGLFIAFNSLDVLHLMSMSTLEAAPYTDAAPVEMSDNSVNERRSATIAAFT